MAETTNAYGLTEAYVKSYTSNVRAALVRQGGMLSGTVSRGSYSGERSQVVNFLGPVEFVERETRYQDTKHTDLQHTQRWITGRDYDCAILVDRIDTLRTIYDPMSPYVERMREAAARKEDEIIMAAFFAAAKSGKDGVEVTAMPAQDTIAHGGTRMSVAKLRAARKLLKKRLVDLRMERPLIAVTAEQVDDLLGEVAVGSNDYNSVKPLVDGEVSSFMGFTFVPAEQLPPTYVSGANTIRQLPVWVPSGMHYGDWQNLAVTVGPRADKNNIPQIHACFSAGATRIEEGKVLNLEVVEA